MAPPRGKVEAVLVGRAERLPADGTGSAIDRPWHTAIHKRPVDGPVALGRSGLVGDQQADGGRHGGPEKAVLLFSADHYPRLAADWELELAPGAFGENLLVTGLCEATVCVGDLWRIGTATLRTTQPRQPGWKLARRWHRTRLPKAMARAVTTGWYARTERPGQLWAGAEAELLERPLPEWTVRRAVEVLYSADRGAEGIRELLGAPYLGASWRSMMATRLRLSESGVPNEKV